MTDRPRHAQTGDVGRRLRREGNACIRAALRGRFASGWQLARGGIAVLGLMVSYGLRLTTAPGPMPFFWAIAVAFFGFGVLANLCHDAAHNSIAEAHWLKRAIPTFGFAIFGVSGHLWGWRHVHLHHIYPNVAGTDIDGEGSRPLRPGAHRPWHPWNRFQAFYAPVLYTLAVAQLAWQEDFRFRRMGLENAPARFATPSVTAGFVLGWRRRPGRWCRAISWRPGSPPSCSSP